MSLNKTLENIKKVLPHANEDVDDGAIETLAGRRGRKRQAEEQLKRLKREYLQDLISSSVFLLVNGEDADKFKEVANEKFGTFSVDGDALIEDVLGQIAPSMYAHENSAPYVFNVASKVIESLGNDLDLVGLPSTSYHDKYSFAIRSKDDVKRLVTKMVVEQVGSDLIGFYAVSKILDKAIEKDHQGHVTPIVMKVEDEVLLASLLSDLTKVTNRVYLIGAGKVSKTVKEHNPQALKNVSENTVETLLKDIKNSLKR